VITLAEAENQIDRAVLAACEPLETDGEAWLKKFFELKRKGWSVSEIAQTLKIQEGMVSLILELGNGSSSSDIDEDDDLSSRRRRRS
jgi:hypothetical protein